MMKFLVIGGSSFIGVYVVDELLSRGAEVVATGRNERFATHYEKRGVPYLNLDICDKGSFDVFGDDAFDGVVSLAARMPANIEKDVNDEDIAEYITTNVVGTINILEWCRSRGIRRLVDIISRFDCRLYDQNAVITEDTPLKFSYCDDHAAYVVSNNEKAEMLNYYNKRYAMRNIWLRIPSVYGVGPHGTFAKDGVVQKSGLQIFMEKATVGEKIVVSLYGTSIWVNSLMIIGTQYGVQYPQSRYAPGNPLINSYKCRDGKWITLTILAYERYWDAFCDIFGLLDIKDDPDYRTLKSVVADKEGWSTAAEGLRNSLYSMTGNTGPKSLQTRISPLKGLCSGRT